MSLKSSKWNFLMLKDNTRIRAKKIFKSSRTICQRYCRSDYIESEAQLDHSPKSFQRYYFSIKKKNQFDQSIQQLN